jgi:predicted outer membrane protein
MNAVFVATVLATTGPTPVSMWVAYHPGTIPVDIERASRPSTMRPMTGLEVGDRKYLLALGARSLARGKLTALGEKRAESEAVRELARRLAEDERRLEGELERLAGKKGLALPTESDPDSRAAYERLAALPKEEFDRAFVAELRSDGDRDLRDAVLQEERSEDDDVRNFVGRVKPLFQAEIDRAERLESELKLR